MTHEARRKKGVGIEVMEVGKEAGTAFLPDAFFSLALAADYSLC
jgi:hypothetical protein